MTIISSDLLDPNDVICETWKQSAANLPHVRAKISDFSFDFLKHPHILFDTVDGKGFGYSNSDFHVRLLWSLMDGYSPHDIQFIHLSADRIPEYSYSTMYSAHLEDKIKDTTTGVEAAYMVVNAILNARQKLFKEYNVSDMEEFRSLDNVPHTPEVFVITHGLLDHGVPFAEKLLSVVARIGRSLGVHLITIEPTIPDNMREHYALAFHSTRDEPPYVKSETQEFDIKMDLFGDSCNLSLKEEEVKKAVGMMSTRRRFAKA